MLLIDINHRFFRSAKEMNYQLISDQIEFSSGPMSEAFSEAFSFLRPSVFQGEIFRTFVFGVDK